MPRHRSSLSLLFERFSASVTRWTGSSGAFGLACLVIVTWIVSGPIFGFSDTWQLVINTGTTIVTFLMVFLIQNMQNRDAMTIQLKLDELIRATQGAHNALLALEQLEDDELDKYMKHYAQLAAAARKLLREGKLDTDSPEIKAFAKR